MPVQYSSVGEDERFLVDTTQATGGIVAPSASQARIGSDSEDPEREHELELDELLTAGNLRAEAARLVWASLPIMASTTTMLFITLPLMSAVGRLGKIVLASMNLVSIFMGLCGVSPLMGITMALDSLCSQGHTAARDRRQLGLYLQRALVVMMMTTLVIYPLWWNSQHVYQMLGIPKDIAVVTGQILRLYFFGILALLVNECLKSYLFAQGIRRFAVYTNVVCLPASWLSIWLLISNERTSVGVMGVPLVIVIGGLVLCLSTLVFIVRFDGYQSWGGWSRASLSGLGPIIRLALAGSAIALCESLALHTIDIGVLFLDTSSMAAQAILSTLLSGTWFMGSGFAIVACNRIGNLLGAGMSNRALLTVYTILGISTVVFVPLGTLLLIGRDRVAAMFTDDGEVAGILAAHIPWAAVGGTIQGINMAFSGIMRGQGRQALLARIRIATFLGISIPLSAFAVLVLHWDLAGLWFGYVAGALSSTCAQAYIVSTTNWNKQVELCQRRISATALPLPLADDR
ncbi:ethionine resistance protein [Coemansia guatemalensis]|uniref:Ethionine resistance protein n=1 Tax=Coemansia guatemalensis TaxID=2761395 RepID=A0A9W8LVE5_9FUNG|nr:ethionine resistance protein [Coemansia guatemalensis]